MPDLSPCYVATESALVAGWNIDSLERALAPGTRRETASSAIVYLDRMPEADVRLARAAGVDDAQAVDYPWQRIEILGRRTDGRYLFDVRLTGAAE